MSDTAIAVGVVILGSLGWAILWALERINDKLDSILKEKKEGSE